MLINWPGSRGFRVKRARQRADGAGQAAGQPMADDLAAGHRGRSSRCQPAAGRCDYRARQRRAGPRGERVQPAARNSRCTSAGHAALRHESAWSYPQKAGKNSPGVSRVRWITWTGRETASGRWNGSKVRSCSGVPGAAPGCSPSRPELEDARAGDKGPRICGEVLKTHERGCHLIMGSKTLRQDRFGGRFEG